MVPSRIFRSRWSALFWAGGILWTAYDVASGQPQEAAGNAQAGSDTAAAGVDATGEPVNARDLAALANVMQ
ncbi:hypothetical protein [uncultured Sphingomonas sp.]|uniref:hypothetical protein n=1 Tax=uncultured Sphingomonas sp. TaxID=158754 RepID=UPI0035CBCFF6